MRRSSHALSAHPPSLALEPLPAVRPVSVDRASTWLGRGFKDFAAHPAIGLTYGAAFAAIGWLLTFGLAELGMGSVILPLAAGFMLVAPFLAVGLYEVSRRVERGETVTLGQSLCAIGRNREIGDMGFVLMLIFFAWFQVSMVIFALFFGGSPPALTEFFHQIVLAPQGPAFLATGTLAGGVLAIIAFALSVVSMPMLLDRDVAVLTAMRTSLKAVATNWKNMIGWAATLATLAVLGMTFFFVGLAITLPIAAHASWHAYRDLVGE